MSLELFIIENGSCLVFGTLAYLFYFRGRTGLETKQEESKI